MTEEPTPDVPYLPFRKVWPVVAGALLGLALRLLFSGGLDSPYRAMAPAFILGVPIVVGAATVFIAERTQRRSWSYYAVAGAFANVLFIAGTLAILIEGIICAIVILPLFTLLGMFGGLLMGALCRAMRWRSPVLFGFAALPLVLAVVGPEGLPPSSNSVAVRSRVIDASPHAVWEQLRDARDIRDDEVGRAWMYRIGVPLPLEGVAAESDGSLVRHIRMGRGIHFDQVSTNWQTDARVEWKYRFFPDSFPPGSLDDHVRIGGEYFDLVDTVYTLSPESGGRTRLAIAMQYRVSTGFNWYAKPVANFLVGNFCEVILDFYAQRAQNGRAG